AFAVAVMAGVIFGLIPAIEAGRADLGHALSGSLRATGSARQHSVGRALIVFELATTLVLLTCAGLLTHSFARVMAIDYGFRPEGVLVEDISLQNTRYSNESAARFFTELLERVRTFPGVEAAALADVAPLGGTRTTLLIRTPSDPIALQQAVREAVRSMDAGLPAPSGTTMEQVLSDAVAPRRFSFVLLAIFGLLAATLAAVGLYGVLAYLVAD